MAERNGQSWRATLFAQLTIAGVITAFLMILLYGGPVVRGYAPHITCLRRDPLLVWVGFVSDLTIGVSYFTITTLLAIQAVQFRKRLRAVEVTMVWVFAAFIFACGGTHFMGAITMWVPIYYMEMMVKAQTAAISAMAAAFVLRRGAEVRLGDGRA